MIAASWAIIHWEEAGPMPHGRVLSIDMATQMFHVVGLDDTGDAVSETPHEKYPKPGGLGVKNSRCFSTPNGV
jgi:hypothetical protein